MTTTKLIDNKRRNHAAKILANSSRKNQEETKKPSISKTKRSRNKDVDIKEQIQIIKDDLVKLRVDVTRGYELAKNWLESRATFKGYIRSK